MMRKFVKIMVALSSPKECETNSGWGCTAILKNRRNELYSILKT
jgi:hypothetical protein